MQNFVNRILQQQLLIKINPSLSVNKFVIHTGRLLDSSVIIFVCVLYL